MTLLSNLDALRTASGPKVLPPYPIMVSVKGPEVRSLAGALIDGGKFARINAGMIECGAGSVVDLSGARLVNAPRDFVIFAGAELIAFQTFVGACGLLSRVGDHVEQIFVHSGKVSFRNSLFDMTGSPLPPKTLTAVLFFKATNGPIDALIDGCVITGAKALGGNYPIQAGSSPFDCVITVRNTGLERGTSGYVGLTKGGAGKVQVIDGGGNYDLDTGASIDLTSLRPATIAP